VIIGFGIFALSYILNLFLTNGNAIHLLYDPNLLIGQIQPR
jgi:hypothetical protein